MTKHAIERIEVITFTYEVPNLGGWSTALKIPMYKEGTSLPMTGFACRVHAKDAPVGEYIGGLGSDATSVSIFANAILGRSALDRQGIYRDAKYLLRQHGRLGLGIVDAALWDLAGKLYGVPVFELLGAQQRPLPCYASTYPGDEEDGGLSTPEAYADFAEQCLELGYPAFKIHGWTQGTVDRQIATVRAVGERVGGRMDLMNDPACALETFNDAVKLGRACDEYGFVWFEDPFRDGGISAQAHRKLRELIRTPLLQMEHLRGLEPKVDFIVAGGTDFVRGDPDFDGGITGVMKVASAAEGFGLDVELHWSGPAHRHAMTAIRNSNYYEMALVHPKFDFVSTATYVSSNYRDGLREVDANGCVVAPDGPGLGVDYDWEHIEKNAVSTVVFGG